MDKPKSLLSFHNLGRWARRDVMSGVAAVILLLLFVAAVAPSSLTSYDPYKPNVPERLEAPSWTHPFGTDEMGRDLFSRTVHGLQISLGAAIAIVSITAVVGTMLGILAGFYGGIFETIIMRVSDIFIAFPQLVMAMVLTTFLGPSLRNAMLSLILIWWPQYARLVRSQVLQLKNEVYVESARSLGASDYTILSRYILRNAWTPIIVKASLDMGLAILMTASLGFMGLGATPPTPELGALVTQGRRFILTAWWYSTVPGLFIFLIVFSFNTLGDTVRDMLDPTLRN